MCGIAGIQGRGDRTLLARFTKLLAHRGPDDSGTWFDEKNCVGLAHTRLSIIDLSAAGHQPMWDSTDQVGIVYNGETYNFRELRAELASSGYRFVSQTDTEVLLAGYLVHGMDFVRRLNGIFAFAIWDGRVNRLFLARDPLGVKPLYYAGTNEGFTFASEMKALLQDQSIDRSVDPEAVFSHLMFLWAGGTATMLKAVRKLEPGCAMTVSGGSIERVWRYYELPLGREGARLSSEEASRQLLQTLDKAVERQMISDVPVGAFLSGGLDSSTIVHLAKRHAKGNAMPCFSIGFRDRRFEEEGFIDDLPYAREAARHIGVDLHVVEVGPEIAYEVERMVYQLDEPQADPAAIHVGLISKLARDHGIKVLLSGTGGDDLFTGYRRHYALAAERYWSWMPQAARRAVSSIANAIPEGASPLLRRIRRGLEYAHLPVLPRLVSYFYWMNPQRTEQLLAPELRQDFRRFQQGNALISSIQALPGDLPPLAKMLYLEQRYFLADHNLNYTDKMGMAHGVEIRVPFLDLDVVRMAAALPEAMKQNGRTSKWILRKTMETRLPHQIVNRPKTGFGAPIHSWLKTDLKHLLRDVLTPEALRRRGLFDANAVAHLIENDQDRSVHSSYTLFAILCIELWCRSFVDAKQPHALVR